MSKVPYSLYARTLGSSEKVSLDYFPSYAQEQTPKANEGFNPNKQILMSPPVPNISQQIPSQLSSTPSQTHRQSQQNFNHSSNSTTHANSSAAASASGSNIKSNKGNSCLSHQNSQHCGSQHRQQTSAGSVGEQSLSEIRGFFAENNHQLSQNNLTTKNILTEDVLQPRKVSPPINTIGLNSPLQANNFSVSNFAPNSTPLRFHTSAGYEDEEGVGDDEITTCPYHPAKKVKYEMCSNPREQFCSNCAVEFARKGFQIQEIPKAQEREMSEFMNEMMNVKYLNKLMMDSFESSIIHIKEQSSLQSSAIKEFFSQIENIFYHQKVNILSVINDQMWESINIVETKKSEAKVLEKKFMRQEIDIQKNREKIQKEMELSEVRQILQYYHKELNSSKEKIKEMIKNTQFQLVQFQASQLNSGIQSMQSIAINDLIQPNYITQQLKDIFNSKVSTNQRDLISSQREMINPNISKLMVNGSEIKQQPKRLIATNQSQTHQELQTKLINTQRQTQYLSPHHALIQKQQGYTQAIEVIDTSVSEKQQTQESEEHSSIQTVEQCLDNTSKISNMIHASSNKIISYSDIHDDEHHARQITKTDPSLPQQNFKYQNKIQANCVSPQSNNAKISSTRQEAVVINQKQKQGLQTEPTHLNQNKFRAPIGNTGAGYQRNLLMNDENVSSMNKFKLVPQVGQKGNNMFH